MVLVPAVSFPAVPASEEAASPAFSGSITAAASFPASDRAVSAAPAAALSIA